MVDYLASGAEQEGGFFFATDPGCGPRLTPGRSATCSRDRLRCTTRSKLYTTAAVPAAEPESSPTHAGRAAHIHSFETTMDVRFNDVLAFAVAQWRQTPRAVALAGGLMFAATMAEIFTPVAIGQPDRRAWRRPRRTRGRRCGRSATSSAWAILFQVLQKSGDYVWAGIAMGIMRRIGAEAFAHVQRFSSDWHADTFAGSTRAQHHARRVGLRHVRRRRLLPSRPVRGGHRRRRRADAVALAADGAGVPGRCHPLHRALDPVVAGLRRADPPRRRRERQPAGRGARRCADLQRRGQEHGGRSARGRAPGRRARRAGGPTCCAPGTPRSTPAWPRTRC